MTYRKHFLSMTHLLRLCLFIFCVALISACKKSPEHSKLIPKDAHLVVAVNLKDMALKAVDFKSLFNKDFFKKAGASEQEAQQAENVFNKVQNSGIDFLNTAYLFGDVNSSYFAVSFALLDEDKFEKFWKDDKFWEAQAKRKMEVKSAEGMKYVMVEKNALLSWSGKTALLLFNDKGWDENRLKEKTLALRKLKDADMLGNANEGFKKLQKESFDVSIWADIQGIQAANNETGFINVDSTDLKDHYITGVMNFEKGEIVMEGNYYVNEDFVKKYGDIFKNGVSEGFTKNIPIQNSLASLSLAFNMQGLKKILTEQGLLAMGGSAITQQTSLTTDEVFQLLSGELIGVLKDLKNTEVMEMDYNWETGKEESVMRERQEYEFVVGVGIGDKKILEKLLTKFTNDKILKKEENFYLIEGKMPIYLVEKGNGLYATFTEEIKNELIKGDKKSDDKVAAIAKESALSFYVNDAISKKIPKEAMKASPVGQVFNVEDLPVESFSMKAFNFKDKVASAKMVATLKNKNENALLTLVKYSQKQAELNGKKSEKAPI